VIQAGHEIARKPEILAYRKTAPATVVLDDRDKVLNKLDQKERLELFMDKWFSTDDGLSIARVYHAFDSTRQFEDLLERHLRKLALEIVGEG